MATPSRRLLAAVFLLLAGTAVVWLSSADARDALPTQVTGAGTARWYKGNLHTHTLSSDGDSTPDEVVRWYREHGYDFVVLTDHNLITEVDTLNAPQGAPGRFLVVRGEEVTSRVGDKPIHVNGFDLRRLVEPPLATTVVTMVQRMVDGIREAKGVPSVNHPNFGWAISADELASVQRSRLFELYNGHPLVNNQGGGGVPGLEEVWDRLLSSGKLIYGIAVDDAHHFKRPWEPAASSPGHGWVYVHSALDPRSLVEALERGDFYSSTGAVLDAVEAGADRLRVVAKAAGTSKYRMQFIGRGGRVLQQVEAAEGAVAWTQPVGVGAQAPR